ncbi:uncharacterized protein CCOS01_09041 [Colletotrichum costaricense]|uniref:Uncharacterized protein n=2 Tax=Colletotrichum acutatum species complex TaxID=2707335 RepID=A0AAI9YUH6_9PEZI|nr:uncharacterized protein CCOS01_09041 [Colletotrichum costaricense]KAK1523954.1 hypothetical protein CCOS01_09041 [Colletotrichum costaricense]
MSINSNSPPPVYELRDMQPANPGVPVALGAPAVPDVLGGLWFLFSVILFSCDAAVIFYSYAKGIHNSTEFFFYGLVGALFNGFLAANTMYDLLRQRNGTFKHSLLCISWTHFFATSTINLLIVVVCLGSFRSHDLRSDCWVIASHCNTLAASLISILPLYRTLFKSEPGRCECMNGVQAPGDVV